MKGRAALWLLAVASMPLGALADDLDAAEVLGRPAPFELESVRLSTMVVAQEGRGWQSPATDAPDRAGSEEMIVVEPSLQVIAHQGPRVRHELWVPVDVVSAASPDAIDVTTSASRVTESGSVDLATTWQATPETSLTLHPVFHLEEQTRGYGMGFGVERSLADGNAVVAASIHQMLDWVDRFQLDGDRLARGTRSSMNANVAFTQVLSATTIAQANYGLTLQVGELGNGWNSMPLEGGARTLEKAPVVRTRQAFVGRVAQWLPWNGALHGYYRLYLDDWGVLAHSAEVELHQRVVAWLTLSANARIHTQTAARFYSTLAQTGQGRRTGDSDLSALSATTFGARAVVDLGRWRSDLGVERYSRSNGLSATILTCSLGARF